MLLRPDHTHSHRGASDNTLQCETLFYLPVGCSGRIESASDLQARLGGILYTNPGPDTVYAGVSHVLPHPDYFHSSDLRADIGLLRLTNPVRYTDTIRPICLPPSNANLDQFKVCVNTGFGQMSPYGLFYLYLAFHYTFSVCTSTCLSVPSMLVTR